jgi:DNA-binding CsgD family transcriptional regulator
MARRGRPPHPGILTPREWEVLACIREELSNEEIAERLGISLDGVKYHVTEILSKLGLENRHDAARWQPEERRPWWTIATLLFRPRIHWFSPIIAGALAVAVAAGVGLLVWALVATRGGGDGGSAGAVELPTGDRLAYVGTDTNLWLIEGGQARRITEDGNYSLPTWSPDGRQLFFIRGSTSFMSLWSYDIESREIRQAPPGPLHFLPEWSPDGQRFLYNDQGTIWISDADGNAREIIGGDFGAWYIAWSPDGKQLAVGRNLPVRYPDDWNAPDADAEIPPENGLYVVNTAGGQPEPLALVEATQTAWDGGMGLTEHPAGQPNPTGVTTAELLQWSPDGDFVVFQAATLSASLAADGEGLFSVPVNGGEPVYHGTMLRSQSLLDWFPNSHRFVFTLGGGRETYINKQLALAEAGTPGAQVIAEDPTRIPTPEQTAAVTPPSFSARTDSAPAVSPDGKRIVFQASESRWESQRLDIGKIEGPHEGIWVADADGTNARQLTSDPRYLDFLPQWSADGDSIVFVRTNGQRYVNEVGTPDADAHAELWIMRSDSSDARPLIADLQRIGSYYGLFGWEQNLAWYRAPP